jgi:hypothetical protein
VNLLLSYAHIVNNRRWIPILELWSSKGLPLIIDSGAFTAMKSGVPIDHTAYIALAKLLQKGGGEKTTEFIQLDVIRDAAQSRANLLREYTEGLRTIPVLTHSEDEEDFAELVEKFNPRVCIAGAVQNTPAWINDKLGRCWLRVEGKTQIHALGYSSNWHPFRSKAYSYDSTSWIAPLRFGVCHVWDPMKGIGKYNYRDVVKKDFRELPKCLQTAYMASGITPNDFFGREGGRTSRSLISFLSSASWLKWARKVERNNQRFFFAAVEPFMLTQLLLGAIHNNRFGFNWPALKPEIRTLHDHLIAGNAQAVEPYLDRAIAAWKGFLVDG